MGFARKVEEFKAITPNDPGVKGVSMKVLSPDEGSFIVRLFTLEPGGTTPYHSHPWEHQVVILSGKGRVTMGDKETKVEKGFYVFIPPGEPHRFVNTENEPLKFICAIPKI